MFFQQTSRLELNHSLSAWLSFALSAFSTALRWDLQILLLVRMHQQARSTVYLLDSQTNGRKLDCAPIGHFDNCAQTRRLDKNVARKLDCAPIRQNVRTN